MDPAGNVAASGVIGSEQGDFPVGFFTVVRLDGRDGAELWRQVLSAPSTGNAVAVDSVGNVAAAGGPRDFTVLKFDGLTGQGQWSQIIQGAASAFDESHSVALDPAGNVITAGFTSNAGSGADFTVVKSDGISGEVLWGQAVDGAANTTDEARSVAVDGAGNVVAAGFLSNTSTGQDFAVMKFDGLSGTERWRHVIDGNGSLNDRALAVTVDAAGDVIAAGHVFNVISSDDFTVMKLDGVTGSELWRHVVNGTANFPDDARAVTVDSAGNVIAAGFIANIGAGFSDFTVIKLDGLSGHELWRQSLNGTSSSFDEANAVTVDGADNVIAAGVMTNSGSGVDFTTIKFDGASGQELWRQSINGAANIFDEAHGVAADSAGNVIAVGSIRNTTTFIDFTVVKFDGVSGQELWRRLITGAPPFISSADSAFAIAVDAAGDAVAAGFINLDFAVVKLDAALGIELWRQVINGTANGFDEACDVALDAAGDVIAAGAIRNTGASADLSVVKLRGSDGSDFVPLAMLMASPTVVSAGRTVTGSWSRIPSPSGSDWIGFTSRAPPTRISLIGSM